MGIGVRAGKQCAGLRESIDCWYGCMGKPNGWLRNGKLQVYMLRWVWRGDTMRGEMQMVQA